MLYKYLTFYFLFMKGENLQIGILLLHHAEDPVKDPKEVLPRNYDIVGKKWCCGEVYKTWSDSLYWRGHDGYCGIGKEVAVILTKKHGVQFTPVGSEDFDHIYNNESGTESFFRTFEETLADAHEKKIVVCYYDPNSKLHVITSPKDFELSSKKFAKKAREDIQITVADYLESEKIDELIQQEVETSVGRLFFEV